MAINHPGDDGSMDLGFGPDRTPEPAGDTVTLTQEQFQDMLARIQGHQEADYAAAFVAQPSQPQPQPHLAELMANLPNPNQDFDGFKRGLGQAADVLEQRQAGTSQQVLLDNAWAMMQANYPDIAEHPDLVQLATTREMEELARRGIDFRAVLAGNMEQAVEQVASRAQASIDRIRGVQGDEANDGLDRGDILQGGQLGPRGNRLSAAPAKGGLVDELKEIQRRMNIY